MLQHVKPQGEVLPGRPFSAWHATRTRAVRARGTFRGPRAFRRARSNPGPPGFFPLSGEGRRLKPDALSRDGVCAPSYLAELRALRLAAATCDRLPKRAFVLKFAVDAKGSPTNRMGGTIIIHLS